MITDQAQTKFCAKPVHVVAEKMGLPEWLVNLRHEATHTELPSLRVLKTGVKYALSWLRWEYWEAHSEVTTDEISSDDIRDAVIVYQQAMFQRIQSRKMKTKWSEKAVKDAVQTIQDVLKSKHRVYLINTLLQDGFLVPTPDQLKVLGMTADDLSTSPLPEIDNALLQFWTPVLELFHQLDYIPLLVQNLLQELCKCNNQEAFATRCLAGWTACLVKAVIKTGATTGDSTSPGSMYNMQWRHLLDLCVENPAKYTLALLPSIIPYVRPAITNNAQKQISELTEIYLKTEIPSGVKEKVENKMIYTVEQITERLNEKESCEEKNDTSGEKKMDDKKAATPENVLPWQLCTDSITWSQYPMGMVPGQPLDDPHYLQLPHDLDGVPTSTTENTPTIQRTLVPMETIENSTDDLMYTVNTNKTWTSEEMSAITQKMTVF
ncbi:ribosomal biogenesis protein LAS1L-like [Saccoglossus kowalevskii]|uniref:Ribosomal biogenesis protein LAS1L-like n=1 Tax=Saccoglossus kowalevskii TaxID=10224 RepID=A0ABM0MVS9_SACKO|nr:PREDICTED: ribosomal biogenesis protein LAS1L-like [Saccoglossus kowalevskii]